MKAHHLVVLYDPQAKQHLTVRVDLDIDVERLAKALGAKAIKNKSGKSKLAAGVVATVTSPARRPA
jgi:hypothetical protein